MQKIIFTDKTEHEIMTGASLGNITVVCNDFSALGAFTAALMKKGNLDDVQFKQDTQVTGEYSNLTLSSGIYFNVDIDQKGKVLASFALREKTEMEKRVDAVESRMEVTEGAVQEIILGK